MHDNFEIIPVLLVLVICGGAFYFQYSRSRSLLEGWAAQNGYEILQREFRDLRRGPFFWTSSKGQTVYYVSVRDREGQVRFGFGRCGGWWLGLWSAKTEVRWDD